MRYRGRKAKSFIDWDSIDYVVGTRDDVTSTGIHRPCHRCRQDVYTSRQYPERVAMICDVCALAIAEEEARTGGETTATIAGPPPAHDVASALEPWRRMVEAGSTASTAAPTKNALVAGRRRGRQRSGDGGRAAENER